MSEPVAPALKRKLIAMLRRGVITRAEAADFARVTRQAVNQWCRQTGFDPRASRALYARRTMERELELNRAPSKRELSQEADDAAQAWSWKNALREPEEDPPGR